MFIVARNMPEVSLKIMDIGAKRDTAENLTEENGSTDYQPVGAVMEAYLKTLNRVSKK